jgi:hypothetical protein
MADLRRYELLVHSGVCKKVYWHLFSSNTNEPYDLHMMCRSLGIPLLVDRLSNSGGQTVCLRIVRV